MSPQKYAEAKSKAVYKYKKDKGMDDRHNAPVCFGFDEGYITALREIRQKEGNK